MEEHIHRLVDDPLTAGLLRPKAILCLRGYRQAALATGAPVSLANAYNGFLREWRNQLETTNSIPNRLAFWNEVIAAGKKVIRFPSWLKHFPWLLEIITYV